MENENFNGQVERLVERNSQALDAIIEDITGNTPDLEEITDFTSISAEENVDIDLSEESVEGTLPKLPVNSATALVSEETSRFSSAIWYKAIKRKSITLAGLGGIGSYVGFLLSRMHPEYIYIYDDDIVESANMSGQLYGIDSIGKSKTRALANIMQNYSNYFSIGDMTSKFTRESTASDIMICGFDNMGARETFFDAWYMHVAALHEEDRKKCLFIDGRLAAEEFQIYAFTGDNTYAIDKYNKECLFTDSEADETLCSYKQTSFCANMIASYIVNIFVNWVANSCPENFMPRSVPFYTSYNAEQMYLKVEE